MKIIALTGGLASGKSTVAAFIHKKYNIPIIDTDIIAKDLVTPGSEQFDLSIFNKIIDKFSIAILNSNNQLDRKKLAQLIFSDTAYKNWLECLLHPAINTIVRSQIAKIQQTSKVGTKTIILAVPLLTEKYLEQNKYIDHVIAVECDPKIQILRATVRDNKPEHEIKAILAQQLNNTQRRDLGRKVPLSIIKNNSNLENLEQQIIKLEDILTTNC